MRSLRCHLAGLAFLAILLPFRIAAAEPPERRVIGGADVGVIVLGEVSETRLAGQVAVQVQPGGRLWIRGSVATGEHQNDNEGHDYRQALVGPELRSRGRHVRGVIGLDLGVEHVRADYRDDRVAPSLGAHAALEIVGGPVVFSLGVATGAIADDGPVPLLTAGLALEL